MAFCKFCGKELKEGEICSCQESASAANGSTPAAPVPDPVPAPAPAPDPAQSSKASSGPSVTVTLPSKDAVNAAAKNVFSSILNVLVHPSTGGSAFVQGGNKIVALMIMGLHAILSSIFALTLILKINSLISLIPYGADALKFSGLKAFFVTLLFSIIFSVLLSAIFFVATKITKMSASLDQVLALASVRSIAAIPLCILAIVLGFINPGASLAVFYGAILLAMLFFVGSIKGLENATEDKSIYTVFIVLLVFIILFYFIGGKMALGLYLPSGLKDSGLQGLLNSLQRLSF